MSEQRIVIQTLPKTSAALDDLAAKTGLSQTDVANRAIQLYAWWQEQRDAGHEVLVRTDKTQYVVELL